MWEMRYAEAVLRSRGALSMQQQTEASDLPRAVYLR